MMTRFADQCLNYMHRRTKELETTLGPSTGDLAVRIGIHSGAITAGVLRGEKGRFQLFGDTGMAFFLFATIEFHFKEVGSHYLLSFQ